MHFKATKILQFAFKNLTLMEKLHLQQEDHMKRSKLQRMQTQKPFKTS